MDPNEILTEIRNLTRIIGYAPAADAPHRLAELVDELDTWITRGGFLPDAWFGSALKTVTTVRKDPNVCS
jgi:hypothetical protein